MLEEARLRVGRHACDLPSPLCRLRGDGMPACEGAGAAAAQAALAAAALAAVAAASQEGTACAGRGRDDVRLSPAFWLPG